MNKHTNFSPLSFLLIILISGFSILLHAQSTSLDEMESTEGWNFIKADGVDLNISIEPGISGKAIRFDYDFTKGTGYGGIQKFFPIDLPDNYEFTFYIKAESPANNFEIKLIDESGDNVWWVSNRNYEFPTEWKKISIKKRHIQFAWGPTTDQQLKRIDRIEFTVASFVGGKGTLWIDNLRFEPLPPETDEYPQPLAIASSSIKDQDPELLVDGKNETFWLSKKAENESLTIDFQTRREYGGLQINWHENYKPKSFDVLISEDAKVWDKVYSVNTNNSPVSFIRLPETESHYIQLLFQGNSTIKQIGIRDISFLKNNETLTPNDFLLYVAEHSPKGNYPRYFSKQASYWTIDGVNNDVKEALINKDGMVEVDKALFSLEPIIKWGDSIYNWNNINTQASLGMDEPNEKFNFTPTVSWEINNTAFETSISSTGEANKSSQLNVRYKITNNNTNPVDFDFYILIRPYQVNPYYQFLNHPGGVGQIKSLTEENGIIMADAKKIAFSEPYQTFAAYDFDAGNPIDFIREEKIQPSKNATDTQGLANGLVLYKMHLEPHQSKEFFAVIPFYEETVNPLPESNSELEAKFHQAEDFWAAKTGHIKFNLPASADQIINTYYSNLVYILINRDKAGIQPGSRSYERSWIRDGALTSSALLKSGIVQEVKDFIDWYASYQYESGKVPCVIDFRGPDPVVENDSHGELIYLIREYFNFTQDTAFLRSKNEMVLKAVDFIEQLIAERSTDHFKNGNDSVRAYYGLVPESISHEGYSAKPMHSYWDNFFTMKGLKDAADIQHILGNTEEYEQIVKIRDSFKTNLYQSLDLAMKTRNIDYVPGCVELGDFDATSTTIALTPCNELKNLPKPQIYNTFDKYYAYFKNRRDGQMDWVNYTPYENRLIGSFIMLDEPEKAHELIKFFLLDQRPQGWNHWAEVVWRDSSYPGFIGDMPHTWVGSDFINAIRSLFVYENEYAQTLVLGAALYQDWIDAPNGMSVEHLPTYYGEISYFINKEADYYHFKIDGNLNLPINGMVIKNFNGGKMPKKVVIDGKESKDFNKKEIVVKNAPAEVLIYY